jgi:prevent-host-death family protein
MEIEIEIEEASRRWADLLKQVAGGARVVLLRNGRPISVLVGREDYRLLQRHRATESALPTGPPTLN